MARLIDYWTLFTDTQGDYGYQGPVVEVDRFGLSEISLDAAFALPSITRQLEKQFAVSDHIGSVCCCASCGNTFDAYESIVQTNPNEVQRTIPADVTTTESITVGTPRQSVIDFSGDIDWFSVTLVAGQTYEISVEGFAFEQFTALRDAIVSLYNESGELITTDDDAGSHTSILGFGDGLLTFTAGETGTYFVAADGFGSNTGGYAVSVETRAADLVSNGPDSTATHTIGEATAGTIDYNADQDWFAVQLEAGETYEFILNIDGTNTLPDGFMSLHNAGGVLLTSDDDGGPGLGSRIVWTAETSGTYFISAQGFTGNSSVSTGTYSITSGLTDPLSPIDAIDWGTVLSGDTIEVYFAGAGETFDGTTSDGWAQFEIDAVMAALNEISEGINLTFVQVNSSASSDFNLLTFDFTSDADPDNDDVLGFFGPPGTGSGSGVGVFGRTATGWSESGLEKGGFGYVTIIHEIGHGLGLAHPHDTGGSSSLLQGVTSSSSTGLFDLNQGIYTTMSYVDGWATAPHGTSGTTGFGWQATMMAFDLAALQQKYGAVDHNTSDTVYLLPDQNTSGTYYELIWDTGGNDTIEYGGDRDTVIDLRAATLLYEEGGGGFVSYAATIHGGYTIANGVMIENATGGFGNDTLTGNDADNTLQGSGGDDTLDGGNGDDTAVFAGAYSDYTITKVSDTEFTISHNNGGLDGTDTLIFVELAKFSDQTVRLSELVFFTEEDDVANGTPNDDVYSALGGNDILRGGDGNDTLNGDSGNDRLFGQNGNDTLNGGSGEDYIRGDLGDDILNGGDDNDILFGRADNDTLDGGAGDDYIDGGTENDTIMGGDGDDEIRGNLDADFIDGGAGNDTLFGGNAIDTVIGGDGDDYIDGGGNNDTIEGGDGNDEIRGNVGSDNIDGGDGDDLILAGGGFDTVNGGAGNDTIRGANGNDILNGGAGDDNIAGQVGRDTINGGDGNDIITGGANVDVLNGDDGNDRLDGGAADDQLNGGDGDDRLNGGDNADILRGGDGADRLNGGSGGDLLNGGRDADLLTGGTGIDVFVFNQGDSLIGTEDLITDLEAGENIVLSTHTFVADAAFSGTGQFEVRYVSGATSTIELDYDGDGVADELIEITGNFEFTSDGEQLTAISLSPGEPDGDAFA